MNSLWKKIAVLIFLILSLTVWYYWKNPLIPKVVINGQTFFVELAVTAKEKEKGLSNRPLLKPSHGMLFVYDHPDTYQFWMKDMRFPLDFIWIDKETIIDLTENVPPPKNSESPEIIKPAHAVNLILEVNAGTIQASGIHLGDKIRFLDK